jgi:hypothetical protein
VLVEQAGDARLRTEHQQRDPPGRAFSPKHSRTPRRRSAWPCGYTAGDMILVHHLDLSSAAAAPADRHTRRSIDAAGDTPSRPASASPRRGHAARSRGSYRQGSAIGPDSSGRLIRMGTAALGASRLATAASRMTTLTRPCT